MPVVLSPALQAVLVVLTLAIAAGVAGCLCLDAARRARITRVMQ